MERSRSLTPWLIVALGLALRLCWLRAIARQPFASDAASYMHMAQHLAAGDPIVPYWPPGVPLYLALLLRLGVHSAVAIRAAMLPFYVGLCWCVYEVAIALGASRRAASLGLVVIALTPAFISASVEPTTEMPSAFLLTLLFCLLLMMAGKPADHAIGFASVAGVTTGCLALVRPASIVLVLLAAAWLFLWMRRWLPPLVTCALAGVVVFAWVAHVHAANGEWVFINTANARNMYLGNNAATPLYRTWWLGSHHDFEARKGLSLDPAERPDSRAMRQTLATETHQYIAQHPGLFLLRTFNRACVFLGPETYTGTFVAENYGYGKVFEIAVIGLDSLVFLAFCVGALAFVTANGGIHPGPLAQTQATLLLTICLLYAAPYFIAFSHPRYHFPLEPLLAAAAAAAYTKAIGTGWRALLPSRVRWSAFLFGTLALLLVQIEFLFIVWRTKGY